MTNTRRSSSAETRRHWANGLGLELENHVDTLDIKT